MSMETKPPVTPDGESGGRSPERYERTDASVSGLLKFAVGLAILIVIALFAMKWTFYLFTKVEPLGPPASPFENSRVLPPSPKLQVQPHLELKDYCESQLQQLNSYGWVDQNNGVVRIPMERAMSLVLQRGLPTRSPSQTPVSSSVSDPIQPSQVPPVMGVSGPCGYLANPSSEQAKK
jgi:hypothetical protein